MLGIYLSIPLLYWLMFAPRVFNSPALLGCDCLWQVLLPQSLKSPQEGLKETQVRSYTFIMNFAVAVSELGSQGSMEQISTASATDLSLYELTGNLMDRVQKCPAPLCRLLVYT